MRILFVLLFFMTSYSNSQAVVKTPITDGILKKREVNEKIRFTERIKYLVEENKIIKETVNSVKKINAYVSGSRKAKRVIVGQAEAFEQFGIALDELSSSNYDPEIVSVMSKRLEYVLSNLEHSTEEIINILSNDFYVMNDASRLEYLSELNKDLEVQKNEIAKIRRSANRYASIYQLYNAIDKN